MFLAKRCRMVAVEDSDDNDQSNGIGKGKLRVLGAFGNPLECARSCHGNSGSGSLVSIKFKFDFHCRKEQGGPKAAADKSRNEESSIGDKQYLDYL
jgi:hypothetical protein